MVNYQIGMKHKLGHWKTEILHNLETILTKYDANLLVRKFASRLKPQLIISLVDERLVFNLLGSGRKWDLVKG